MKIVLLSSSFSGLTQRVYRELALRGHDILEHYDLNPALLRSQLQNFNPRVIICPFLTQRIPEDIWSRHLCLVVHPGIEGDRGASSLDWAISESAEEWGVTLLEAVEEMDAGDIWGTRLFPMRTAGKTSIYKREVSTAAVSLILEAIDKLEADTFVPRPLDYGNSWVKGELRPFCKQHHRQINWLQDNSAVIARKLYGADTSPGVLDEISGHPVHLFGGVPDYQHTGKKPGELIGHYKGAVLRATIDGSIWIKQLKAKNHASLPPIKLAATQVINTLLPDHQLPVVTADDGPCPVEDIRVEQQGEVSYVYFNFYNGAFNTRQCQELTHQLRAIKNSDTKVIVLMGGEDFWGNGIHLNCIEAAEDPARESWQNINAIDDLIYEIINTPNQLTVAAVRNNAGAGGAIMALACDEVILRDGVVLNPHYKNMGLFGSEYWTYLLPKRVGLDMAEKIVNECQPMLAAEAMTLGYADCLYPEQWQDYHNSLFAHCHDLSKQKGFQKTLKAKRKEREKDEQARPLASYRQRELAEMRKIFFAPDSEYHHARRAFVYKEKRESTMALDYISLAYGT